MPLIEIATKDARKLLKKQDRDRPTDDTLENYLSPQQEIEVFCTTQEREDFEMEQECQLTADVIDDAEVFAKLLKYLAYVLKRI